jgi:hypothetical protein
VAGGIYGKRYYDDHIKDKDSGKGAAGKGGKPAAAKKK